MDLYGVDTATWIALGSIICAGVLLFVALLVCCIRHELGGDGELSPEGATPRVRATLWERREGEGAWKA